MAAPAPVGTDLPRLPALQLVRDDHHPHDALGHAVGARHGRRSGGMAGPDRRARLSPGIAARHPRTPRGHRDSANPLARAAEGPRLLDGMAGVVARPRRRLERPAFARAAQRQDGPARRPRTGPGAQSRGADALKEPVTEAVAVEPDAQAAARPSWRSAVAAWGVTVAVAAAAGALLALTAIGRGQFLSLEPGGRIGLAVRWAILALPAGAAVGIVSG